MRLRPTLPTGIVCLLLAACAASSAPPTPSGADRTEGREALGTQTESPESGRAESAPDPRHRHARVDLSGVRLVDDPAEIGPDAPFQRFLAVPGRVVGLLWSSGPQPWGATIGHTGQIEAGPNRVEYKFGFDGSSPYAVYFASDGRGENFLRGWGVPTADGTPFHADAAMFTPTTPNEFGLHRRAHLVELEVNGGHGGGGIHFVVTNARVLDGTAEFPYSPEDELIAMRQTLDAALEMNADDALARLRERTAALGADYRFGHASEEVGIQPTFDRETRQLVVRFRVTHTISGLGAPVERLRPCPPCPPGAPCMRCEPQPYSTRPTIRIGYLAGARFVVDARGDFVERTILRPRHFETHHPGRDGISPVEVDGSAD